MLSRRLICLVLFCAAAQAADGKLPWKDGDDPPALAGVQLGISRDQVEGVLGKAPEAKSSGTGLALIYVEKGVVVILNAAREAAVVYLLSPAAGELDGVHVGDDREAILAHWGMPQIVQGAEAMYLVGNWAVVVELGEQQKVVQLSVTRVFGDTNLF